ncbi:MAG: hypothetical protein H0W83_05265 [Planctomycetes bacterium]|nr:hypothetical protein [Planctomycetota bacterium]
MRISIVLSSLLLPLVLACGAFAAQETVVVDFETDADLALWEFGKKSAALVAEHATHGKTCVKISSDEGMTSYRLPKDWSAGDSFDMDFFVEGTEVVSAALMIGDTPWEQKRTYWNRHNGGFTLKPGANTISLPVNGLFRGEAGSRGNDLKTNIDPHAITLFVMSFSCKTPTSIFMDYVRLVKESRPEGIIALDFGPDSQPVFPGFTAVSPATVHGQNGAAAGFARAGMPNRGRDDTFPTRLYQDWVEPCIDDLELVIDVPNGKHHVWFVYSDCGYWGGEEAKSKRRSIDAEGKEAYVDDRGDAGPTDYLFHFEKVEPKPGDSVWDLYMKDLFKSRTFAVTVADGALNLKFHTDAGWSSKIAAMIVYPDAKKTEAEKWIAEIEARNRKEFDGRAVYMGAKPVALDVPAPAKTKGWWLGYPKLESALAFGDAPGAADGRLARPAAKGQRVSFTYAIRPLKDFGEAKVTCGDLTGPGGKIPAANVELRYVQNGLHRSFNDISYTIVPVSARRVAGSGMTLGKDLTRQFYTTVTVPADAKPGTYAGEISINAGALKQTLPLSVEVLDLTLDEPQFPVGYFGIWAPDELPQPRRGTAMRELLTTLRTYGMTSFTSGPNVAFTGLDAAGKPQLDFAACDAFFKLAKECGFTQDIFSYGGPGMVDGLQDGYVIGATGYGWEQKTGKSFGELLKIVWPAMQEHAKQAGWPTIRYGFADEPRTVEGARELAELHKAYHDNVPSVPTGGFYSVEWGDTDFDKAVQESFKNLTWSALNGYKQIDLDKAKEFKRELCMYNQGDTRFIFGQYSWARMNQGFHGFMQWSTCGISGYQHFDLDGREPDFAMIEWGQDEIIPSVALLHCSEGTIDLRYAVTLANLAKKKSDNPAAKAALDWLKQQTDAVPAEKRTGPEGEEFRDGCIGYVRKLMAGK